MFERGENLHISKTVNLLQVNYYFDVVKHWCLRKFNHFSFVCVPESQRRVAQRQMKKQSPLQKMLRHRHPATSLSMCYYEYLQNSFHLRTKPRTPTQCFSLFIKSCFISFISLVFHTYLQHGVLHTSLVWTAGQQTDVFCRSTTFGSWIVPLQLLFQTCRNSLSYLHGSCKCPHQPQIWSVYLGVTMGRNSCGLSSAEVSSTA